MCILSLAITLIAISCINNNSDVAQQDDTTEDNLTQEEGVFTESEYNEILNELNDYKYTGEEYVVYLNEIYDDASRVYAKVGDITYYEDYYGDAVTLYDGQNEVIVYYVYDSQNVLRRKDVKLSVFDIDYSDVWTREDFKTPYVNYMYHARQAYPEQKKRAFDTVLEMGLDFDDFIWGEMYRSAYGATFHYYDLPLLDNNIYLNKDDVNTIMRGLWDSEPRIFMIYNMDIFIYYSTDSTTGLIKTWGLFAQNKTTDEYNEEIDAILSNSEWLLENSEDDMTYAQSWKYVTDAYASWMTYTDGGSLSNSVGYGQGKCNGNSQGLVYLSQRLNMKSIYAEGWSSAGFHAWTYNKLPDEDAWYLTDRLWYTVLGTVEGYTSSHSVYTNRGYTYPLLSDVAYDSYKFTYPSIWASFASETLGVKVGNNIDLYDNITGLESIFDDDMTVDDVTISIVSGDNTYNVSQTKDLALGLYTAVYTLNFEGITRVYELDLAVYNDSFSYSDVASLSELSVYAGGSALENYATYDKANELYGYGFTLNDGNSTSIDVSGYDANTLSLKYGTSISSRSVEYTMNNCNISLSIYADGVLIYQGSQLTAWSTYEDVFVVIPYGTENLTFKTNAYGSGGNHGTLIDLEFGKTY